jgi:hypothetical protein
MSIENDRSGRLDENEAHDEANMLKAHIGVSPETGNVRKGEQADGQALSIERPPTAEDYDDALKALEQLEKDLRDESPLGIKAIIRFNQLMGTLGLSALLAGRALDAVMSTAMGEGSLGENWERSAHLSEKEWDRIFSDARTRLRRMKAAGKEFEARETHAT